MQNTKIPSRANIHAVHSLDRVVFTVPDLLEATNYYSAFGLDVRNNGMQVDLHTDNHTHCWASIFPSGKKKKLEFLVFAAYPEDMQFIGERIANSPYINGIPHPLGSNEGFWVVHPEGFYIQVIEGKKTSPLDKSEPIKKPRAPVGKGNAPTRSSIKQVRPKRLSHALLFSAKVDLLIAPYATNVTAPIMPMVKERGLLLMGNFSFQVNAKVQHDMWFNNAPWGDAKGWSEGFLDAGKKAGAKSIAIFAAEGEFQQNLANGAREIIKSTGWNVAYDQNYPGNNTDFSSIIRSVRASKAEAVFVACYPNESVAIMRSVNEIGLGPQVQIFGGGMVGLQFGPVMQGLGSLLNGVVNYNSYVPGMKYPGIEDFLKRYTERALAAKVDQLGYYLPPYNYAIGQMIEQAVNATKSLDHKRLADYLRKNEMKTIVGPISFDKNGERAKPALVQAQFRNIKDNDWDQFRAPGKQVVIWPSSEKQGDVITPFDKARKAT